MLYFFFLVYEMYVRGGNPDGRGGTIDAAQELGNCKQNFF